MPFGGLKDRVLVSRIRNVFCKLNVAVNSFLLTRNSLIIATKSETTIETKTKSFRLNIPGLSTTINRVYEIL